MGTGISERVYGSAYLTGTEYKDTVCMLLSSCVNEFEYFAVVADELDAVAGINRRRAKVTLFHPHLSSRPQLRSKKKWRSGVE